MTALPPEPSPGSLAFGIVVGLLGAASSAVSYLVSRHHGTRVAGGGFGILVRAHVVLGLACIPLILWLAPRTWPPAAAWLPPLFGSTALYTLGQCIVFAAIKRVQPSRFAPLLGLKIAILAVIVSLLPGDRLDAQQWIAVGLSVFAAILLQRGGASTVAIVTALAACLVFSVSDILIVRLIRALQLGLTASGEPLGPLAAGALAMAVPYATCGLIATAVLTRLPPGGAAAWSAGVSYAAAWGLAMAGLYVSFGFVGVVFGNVIQSTRGIMSVVTGAALAHLGWHDLEERVDRSTLAWRTIAAVLMTIAIAVYAIDLS